MVKARITIVYTLIGDSRPHQLSGYSVTSCFRTAAKCNKILYKIAQNEADRPNSPIIWSIFNLESPNFIRTPRLTYLTGYDVTKFFQSEVMAVRKTAENAASDGFVSNLRGDASPSNEGLLLKSGRRKKCHFHTTLHVMGLLLLLLLLHKHTVPGLKCQFIR